jgi:hypothetical protein
MHFLEPGIWIILKWYFEHVCERNVTQAWTTYDLDDFNYFACSARATIAEACGAENDVPSSPPTQSKNSVVEVCMNEIAVNKDHDQIRQPTRIPFPTLTLVLYL